MEGGSATLSDGTVRHGLNLVSAISDAVSGEVSDADIDAIEAAACPTCGSCSGMFTANSMNCLVEALGLALPANGPTLATHSAFDNAMSLDIAMGGSTNTVLHLLAAAREAELDYTLRDIEARSRVVPCMCKLAPSSSYLMEDVHRAGGVPAILGELHRTGLLHDDVHTIHAASLEIWLKDWDIRGGSASATAVELFHAAPGRVRSAEASSQSERWASLDLDAEAGCIRDVAHAYTADGGLAVLWGYLAENGSIVKTAGVDASILAFTGPALVVESQEDAVDAILTGRVTPGDVVVVR